MPDYSRMNPAEFVEAFEALMSLLDGDPEGYSMTAAQVTALQSKHSTLASKFAARNAQRLAAKAADVEFNTALKLARKEASTQSNFIASNPNISAAKKQAAGISPKDTEPTPIQVVPPSELNVRPQANGINSLRWKPNGNKKGTTYIIEARLGVGGAWAIVNTTTKTKFDHTGQTPGALIFYRVRARRSDLESGNSNEAVAYA